MSRTQVALIKPVFQFACSLRHRCSSSGGCKCFVQSRPGLARPGWRGALGQARRRKGRSPGAGGGGGANWLAGDKRKRGTGVHIGLGRKRSNSERRAWQVRRPCGAAAMPGSHRGPGEGGCRLLPRAAPGAPVGVVRPAGGCGCDRAPSAARPEGG
jgi:hypothetical protein